MKCPVVVCLLVLGAGASPTADFSLEAREVQLLSIVEGLQQMSLLLRDSWYTGSAAARALSSQLEPSTLLRNMQESDPIEASLKALGLDNEVCRSRAICELQSKITSYSMGDLAYEFFKRKVPKLKKYGVVTARSLGAQSCFEVFPCRANDSPLMQNARNLRSLVEDFCDLSASSMTASFCRGIKYTVDQLETL